MKISIILPTRKRNNQLKRLISSICDTAYDISNIEVCIYYDYDDKETLENIIILIKEYPVTIKYITNNEEKLNISQMWNYAYNNISSGDIIMQCGDDVEFKTKNWDKIIIEEFMKYDDKIVLLYGDDLLQHERLATHSFVHKKWIEISGFWLPPYFVSDYTDTWLNEVATNINRKVYLPNVITEHHHFTAGKAEIDETTQNRLDNHIKYKPEEIWKSTEKERTQQSELLLNYIKNYNISTDIIENFINIKKYNIPNNNFLLFIILCIFIIIIYIVNNKKIFKYKYKYAILLFIIIFNYYILYYNFII